MTRTIDLKSRTPEVIIPTVHIASMSQTCRFRTFVFFRQTKLSQNMALRTVYAAILSQRHLLAAIENNRLEGSIIRFDLRKIKSLIFMLSFMFFVKRVLFLSVRNQDQLLILDNIKLVWNWNFTTKTALDGSTLVSYIKTQNHKKGAFLVGKHGSALSE